MKFALFSTPLLLWLYLVTWDRPLFMTGSLSK
jgi:hypothetical protein